MMHSLLLSLIAASTCWHRACSNASITSGTHVTSPGYSLSAESQGVHSKDAILGESSTHYISFKRNLRRLDDPGIKSPLKDSDPGVSSTTSSTTTTASPASASTTSTNATTRSSDLFHSPSLPSDYSTVPTAAVFETDPIDHRSSQTEITGTESTLSIRDTLLPSLPDGSASAGIVDTHFPGSEDETLDREICDFCIYQGEGNFTSYAYPLNYKSHLNCTYRIQRVSDILDVCELDLVFHDFDVPVSSIGITRAASNDCREDYLEVSGRRYCGSGWRDKIESISFPINQKEIVFRFVSNERASGRGFYVEVKRKPGTCYDRSGLKSCEERFNEQEFLITSPKFPDSYPSNAECSFFIRKSTPSVCALELHFMHFDIESVNGCFYDYIEIDGQKLCGTYLQEARKVIEFHGDQKVITFHSDKQVNRSGFRIGIKQMTDCHSNVLLPAPPSCNICARDMAGTLVSYNYPDPYRNNLLCTYTIDRVSKDVCAVELFFDDFDILPSVDCFKDYLQVSGQRFCGTSLHSSRKIVSFGNEDSLTMVFRTNDALSSKGFSLKYKQLTCRKNDEQQVMQQQSPSTPSPAPESMIHPPPGNLYFQSTLETGGGQQQQQNPDIQDHQQANQQQQFTQQIHAHQLQTLQSQVNSKSCDYIYTDKVFYLKSENYSSGNYPDNSDCSYFVKRNSSRVCYLELSFLRFDVEASAQCQFDYLEINNVRLCGSLAQETTRTYIFDGKEKWIKFHSDGSTSRSGYVIKVDQLECESGMIIRPPVTPTAADAGTAIASERRSDRPQTSKSCNQFFMSAEFEIQSPGFPRTYPADTECTYYIKKHNYNVCRLEVIYQNFDLEPADLYGVCKNDFLDFNGIRMCGSLPVSEIRHYYFPENEFKVRFVSNNKISRQENTFSIRIRQLDCDTNSITASTAETESGSKKAWQQQLQDLLTPSNQRDLPGSECDHRFTDITFDIKSLNYPSSYSGDLDCRYTIVKSSTKSGHTVCQLEVHFVELEMPASDANECSIDYLNFDAFGRVCGSVPSGTVKFFPFDGNVFSLTFRSDAGRRDRIQNFYGFHLKIRQRECLEDVGIAPSEHKKSHISTGSHPGSISSSQLPGHIDASLTGSTHRQDLSSVSTGSTQCGEMISALEFEVRSPYYPSSYSQNVECVYTIKKSNSRICSMELRFVEFDVEESDHCEKDYLLMDGKKFCGRYKANTLMNFDFSSSSEKILYFRSDSQHSNRGFLITGRQKRCEQPQHQQQDPHEKMTSSLSVDHQSVKDSTPGMVPEDSSFVPSICELCFTDSNGMLTSYAFPKEYPANLNCKYKISAKPESCSLEMKFDEFHLPGSQDCSDDYLEIDHTRYCGTMLRGVRKIIPFKFSGTEAAAGQVVVKFSSNRFGSGRGFRAVYSQLPCEAGSSVASATAASIQSPTFGPAPPLSAPSSSSSSTDLVTSSLTSGNRISVLDTGVRVEGSASSIYPRVPCDLVLYDMYFEISSPGYPYGYPVHADCLYSIRRLNDRICSIVLHFNELDLDSTDGCTGDFLEIGPEKMCHSVRNGTKMEYSFTSYKIAVRFKSDGIRSRNKGFFINGYQKECNYPSVQYPDASQTRNSYYPSSSSSLSFPSSSQRSIHPPYDQQPLPATRLQHALAGVGKKAVIPASGRSPEYPRDYIAKSFLEQIVESQVHVMDRRDSRQVPQVRGPGRPEPRTEGRSIATAKSPSPSPGNAGDGSQISYSILSSTGNPAAVSSPPASSSLINIQNKASGSPEYPNNYVAKALLEQIVETTVHVVDSKDGLHVPQIQFSNRGTRPGIHANSSYISLG